MCTIFEDFEDFEDFANSKIQSFLKNLVKTVRDKC